MKGQFRSCELRHGRRAITTGPVQGPSGTVERTAADLSLRKRLHTGPQVWRAHKGKATAAPIATTMANAVIDGTSLQIAGNPSPRFIYLGHETCNQYSTLGDGSQWVSNALRAREDRKYPDLIREDVRQPMSTTGTPRQPCFDDAASPAFCHYWRSLLRSWTLL